MKKIVSVLTALTLLVVMIGADIRRNEAPAAPPAPKKKPCYGYTIIEFGKGINCHGDTIALTKVRGGQQFVQASTVSTNNTGRYQ